MTYRNIRLHPVLRLIYFALRLYAWVGMQVFYRRRTVLGAEYAQFDGPAIVISNHPSTLMDVLNIGIPIRQEMFFLANYSLFKNPVSNWLLSRLFCIPVKRKEDVSADENRNNDAAFKMSFKHLESNGVLFIAAEGVSWMNRWVRPFKSGAARIAFGTESRHNWDLGVKIIPVGLSYSAANLFRSEVVVHFGKPIMVSDWAAAWQQKPERTVDDFTTLLEETVRSLTIDTRDEAGERNVGQWEEMLQNDTPVAPEEAFFRSRLLGKEKIDDALLCEQTEAYTDQLQKMKLRDVGLQQLPPSKTVWNLLLLIAGFPFFVVGGLFWLIPCYLPGLLAKKLKLYIGYDSNIKTVAGSLTFGVALAWAPHFIGVYNPWLKGVVILICIGLGYFTEYYLEVFGKWSARRRFQGIPVEAQQELRTMRLEILRKIKVKGQLVKGNENQ